MAIIKCPECGHEVSDKAPFCPNCGVKIEGNPEIAHVSEAPKAPQAPQIPQGATSGNNNLNPIPPQQPKSNTKLWIIAIIAAVVLAGGITYYATSNQGDSKEQIAYENAMRSEDPDVLKSYLDTFSDADQDHIDSIQAHLALLQKGDQDWTNAIVNGTKAALEQYLQNHPDSPHKQEAWSKIDSLDWASAQSTNTIQSYQEYLNAHADGKYVNDAESEIKKQKSKDVQPEEKKTITGLYRRFFQSINSKNEGGLTASCENVMSSFLGKNMATHSDIINFMNKIWKDDITNMNWHINNDYEIKKREVGDDEYEYQVSFSAVMITEHTEASNNTSTKYNIKSTVSPDGKISSMNMVKIIE